MAQHRITLLGTGSSGGVPRVGGDWGACDPEHPYNRRRRCSALLDRLSPDGQMTRVLIDTSPDMREQLLDNAVKHLDALIYTHDHADQTHGIDDVRALVLAMRKPIRTYMDTPTRESLTNRFNYCFVSKGGYPAILDLQHDLTVDQPLVIGGPGGAIEILPLDQEHGGIRSLAFRVGDLAYCNDVSNIPPETMAQLKGLDTFIVDALRYTPHPTHAHLQRVLDWIEQLKPKQTILTNLHVDMDYETLREELPRGVIPGYDNMQITFEV